MSKQSTPKIYFGNDGKLIRGKHVGVHARDLPLDYAAWCGKNVVDWQLQYEDALANREIRKAVPLPRSVLSKPNPLGPIQSSQGSNAGSIKNAGLAKPGTKKSKWRPR
jgi:hypothetical protein